MRHVESEPPAPCGGGFRTHVKHDASDAECSVAGMSGRLGSGFEASGSKAWCQDTMELRLGGGHGQVNMQRDGVPFPVHGRFGPFGWQILLFWDHEQEYHMRVPPLETLLTQFRYATGHSTADPGS